MCGYDLGFGHEKNPARIEERVKRGDVIIVPAGVGHRLIVPRRQ